MGGSTEQSRASLRMRLHAGEQGEGVISAAIAVLVMAFLGALMWGGFQLIYNEAEDNVREQVREIGS